MAIYCDVCGFRISSAIENEGGFPAPNGFVSRAPLGGAEIRNTCEDCGKAIKAEVLVAIENAVTKIRTPPPPLKADAKCSD